MALVANEVLGIQVALIHIHSLHFQHYRRWWTADVNLPDRNPHPGWECAFFIAKKKKKKKWLGKTFSRNYSKTVNTTAWRNIEDSKAYCVCSWVSAPCQITAKLPKCKYLLCGWFHTLLPTDSHIKINMHAMENSTLPFVNSTNAALLVLQPCSCVFYWKLRGRCSEPLMAFPYT